MCLGIACGYSADEYVIMKVQLCMQLWKLHVCRNGPVFYFLVRVIETRGEYNNVVVFRESDFYLLIETRGEYNNVVMLRESDFHWSAIYW